MDLETWMQGVGSLALKAFAEDMPNARGASKPKVIEWILANGEARERATESMKIEERVFSERA